ncbi:MAG: hypothetical protein PF961_01205 [Planctomycetota bacterium]|jgi:hypothetical protein|nr:hypothetical protein [Planctomycetota bacterium]
MTGNASRRGFLLIIVLGVMTLTATLAITFVVRSRHAGAKTNESIAKAQVRVMLAAAGSYICETSRIGWNDPATSQHELAYGWVDVRDGQLGPKTQDYDNDGDYDLLYSLSARESDGVGLRPVWPAVGGVVIAPMYRHVRPPHAISQNVAPNAISSDATDPLYGVPVLRNRDPEPAATTWSDIVAGDMRPEVGSMGMSWFRIFRDGPVSFTVTVGAGGTRGYRDWPEVVALGQASLFGGSQDLFEVALATELRLWYRMAWSPAIGGVDLRYAEQAWTNGRYGSSPEMMDEYFAWRPAYGAWTPGTMPMPWPTTVNQGGTLSFIQRLRGPPADGEW